ncbi:hypothetical protein BJX76DRAFT_325698 [Aspergillus varians]
MRLLSIFSFLATLSVCVLAQDTTSTATSTHTASSCDAQNILDACVKSIQVQVDACSSNEWDCLCEQTSNMLTCYNNCPGDGGRNGVQQQRLSYCNAAGQLSSTSTSSHSITATRTTTSSEETAVTSTSSEGAAASETAEDAAMRLEMGLGAGVGVGLVMLGGFV